MSPADAPPVTDARRQLRWAYALFGIGAAIPAVAIAGAVLAHLRVDDSGDELCRLHYRWLLRTFWYSVLWYVVGLALVVIGVGLVIIAGVWIWYVYRVVRGVLAFVDGTEPRSVLDEAPLD